MGYRPAKDLCRLDARPSLAMLLEGSVDSSGCGCKTIITPKWLESHVAAVQHVWTEASLVCRLPKPRWELLCDMSRGD